MNLPTNLEGIAIHCSLADSAGRRHLCANGGTDNLPDEPDRLQRLQGPVRRLPGGAGPRRQATYAGGGPRRRRRSSTTVAPPVDDVTPPRPATWAPPTRPTTAPMARTRRRPDSFTGPARTTTSKILDGTGNPASPASTGRRPTTRWATPRRRRRPGSRSPTPTSQTSTTTTTTRTTATPSAPARPGTSSSSRSTTRRSRRSSSGWPTRASPRANTLFLVTVDEGDHFAGGAPLNPGCDGVNDAVHVHELATEARTSARPTSTSTAWSRAHGRQHGVRRGLRRRADDPGQGPARPERPRRVRNLEREMSGAQRVGPDHRRAGADHRQHRRPAGGADPAHDQLRPAAVRRRSRCSATTTSSSRGPSAGPRPANGPGLREAERRVRVEPRRRPAGDRQHLAGLGGPGGSQNLGDDRERLDRPHRRAADAAVAARPDGRLHRGRPRDRADHDPAATPRADRDRPEPTTTRCRRRTSSSTRRSASSAATA